jgi:hypothetical protein
MKIKILFKIIFSTIFITINILAQPYYFDRGKLTDSASKFTLYNIEKINLSNGKTSIFLHNGGEDLIFDQTQTWIGIGWYDFYYIYNYSDTKNYFSVNPFDQILYSQRKKKIYLFCWNSNFINKQLAVYDVSEQPRSKQSKNQSPNTRIKQTASDKEFNPGIIDRKKIALLNLPINSNIWSEAFFSFDENTIYFTKKDSAYGAEKIDNTMVEYYSTTNNQISPGPKLSSIGYPNADGYDLYKGRQGRGIIKSFIKNQTKDRYFNIYDFDNNISSNFIFHQGFAEPFISEDNKFLLLAEQGFEISGGGGHYYNTGVLKIYDVANNSLIKTLNFPTRGTFFMSDSYPANIYYIGPYKNRYIRSINIDSVVQQSVQPVPSGK